MIIGRNLVEEERLYSTGDYELDDLLEKAFCDGYEYAQREFAEEDEYYEEESEEPHRRHLSTGAKIGIGAAGTIGLGAAGIGGARGIGENMVKKAGKIRKKEAITDKLAKELTEEADKLEKRGKNLQKPANAIHGAVRKAGKAVGTAAKNVWNGEIGVVNAASRRTRKLQEAARTNPKVSVEKYEKLGKKAYELEKKAKKVDKIGNRAALIAAPVLTAGGIVASKAIKKHKANKAADEAYYEED